MSKMLYHACHMLHSSVVKIMVPEVSINNAQHIMISFQFLVYIALSKLILDLLASLVT